MENLFTMLKRRKTSIDVPGLSIVPRFQIPRRLVGEYVAHYNNERLHSAIGYVAPNDKLNGNEKQIWEERDRKLDEAREMRKARRMATRGQTFDNITTPC